MISHQEAEILTSARQDAPLDPLVERELQAHLATCDQCRAFAAATERLTAGLRTLPTVAANPRIKREVMTRVRAGRNPFAAVFGGFGSGFRPGPALAAVALVALIGLFGWIAMDRLFLENGGDDTNQIAAVPTEAITREAPNPTATTPVMPTATTAPDPTATNPPDPTATTASAPTATTAPAPTATAAAEPTATTAPAPTATSAPEPTATTAPEPTATTAPAPTATTAPAPTATTAPEPTATTAPAPTATTAPEPTETGDSAARTSGEGPVDLTTASSTETTVEPTVPPTETPAPTQAVLVAETPQPTASEVPPTETPQPTETPEPTTAPEPTPSPTPGIEPMEGSTSVPVEPGEAAVEPGIGSADEGEIIPAAAIEPTQDGEAATSTTPPGVESAGDGTGGTEEPVGIELIGTDGESATLETTPEATTGATETVTSTADTTEPVEDEELPTQSLAEASGPYQGIVGDPSQQLGLTRDGRLEFMSVPDGASMTTPGGYRLQPADAQPGVVNLCLDGVCEPGMEAPEVTDGWQGDVPMGAVDGDVFILRLYVDRSEVYAARAEGAQLVDVSLVSQIGPSGAPAAVYESGGTLYAWLPSGQWLQMSGNSAQALSGSYANPTNVRFAPSANGGPLIGYFSGGTLVVAPVGSPDSAILTLPAEGIDFDISPPGDRVAVIQGGSIVIYDLQGNQVAVYDSEGMQPGSVIWLRGGIVWVDRTNGQLYQIPETAP